MIPQEIEDRIVRCPMTGHWYWAGCWNSGNGYSKVRWQGRIWMVHRLIWMVHRLIWTFVNGSIPDDRPVLDHLPHCRWRPCIRPDHLEPVTVAENTRRGEAVLITVEMWRGARA